MFNVAHHAGKEPLLQLFRHRVLRYHRLAPTAPPPSEHSALLIRKQGRRGIANFEDVRMHIEHGCEGQCSGIARLVPASFEKMTIRAQVCPRTRRVPPPTAEHAVAFGGHATIPIPGPRPPIESVKHAASDDACGLVG